MRNFVCVLICGQKHSIFCLQFDTYKLPFRDTSVGECFVYFRRYEARFCLGYYYLFITFREYFRCSEVVNLVILSSAVPMRKTQYHILLSTATVLKFVCSSMALVSCLLPLTRFFRVEGEVSGKLSRTDYKILYFHSCFDLNFFGLIELCMRHTTSRKRKHLQKL